MAGRWACGGRAVHGAEKRDSARLVQRQGGVARGRRRPAGGPGQSVGVRAARAGQSAVLGPGDVSALGRCGAEGEKGKAGWAGFGFWVGLSLGKGFPFYFFSFSFLL